MESVQLKIEFENSLRRASISRTDSLAKAKANISALIGIADFDLKYRDEENDFITIGSDQELQDVLESSAKSGKLLRLTVVPRGATEDDESPSGESYRPVEETPPEPEIPWINLARALADPETVARIQQTLQSPVITEAINRASEAYIDSKGDTLVSGIVASQQIPSLMAVLAELLEELPVLRDLQVIVMNWLAGNPPPVAPFAFPGGHEGAHPAQPFGFFGGLRGMGFGPQGHHPFGPRGHHPFGPRHHFGPGQHHHHPFGPHHGPGPHHQPCDPSHHGPGPHHHPHGPHHGPGPHHHPHGPHHGPGHHHHPHGPHDHHGPNNSNQGPNKQKHVGVFCDGCTSDPTLKTASVAAGHQTRRGFISGIRYKSQAVADFDLCESCKATDRFSDATYGPFTAITEGNDQRMRGCGGGGRGWWNDHREGGRGWWHDHRNREHPNWRNRSEDNDQEKDDEVPQAEKQNEMAFFEAIRSAFSKGSEAFAQAAKNEGSDFGEIARAIAESLKGETPSEKPKTAPKPEEVPVATPAQPEDPFVKWAPQLQQLQVLGFDNLEAYIDILEEEKGDLDRVVNRIVVRDS